MTTTPPPCRIVLRSKDGIEVFEVPSKGSDPVEKKADRAFLLSGMTTNIQEFSPDGAYLYVHQPAVGVVRCKLDGSGGADSPFLKDSKGVQMLAVSPRGTYLLTWERYSNEVPNLKVWEAATGKHLHGFVQKNLKSAAWPYVHWTHDEKFAFLLNTNEVRVYPQGAFEAEETRFTDKLRVPGISSLSVPKTAETTAYLFTSFCPITKDKPARSSLHKYPSKPTVPNATFPSLLNKSAFQAEEATVKWSPKGDAALMHMQTSVDTSGESYYGSSTLYLMAEANKDVVSVPLPKNSTGPVLDVSWMPNPAKPPCFAVISGRMPTMGSLHHGGTAEAIFLFGNAHRNTIAWAGHGRFVCLAGFGNLAGGMTFWDRNKLKPIPQYDKATGVPVLSEQVASCTVGYGWSPSSELFFSSTTSPRMNVDNGVKVYRYNGELLSNMPWSNETYKPDKLLQAAFVPAAPATYPDRPQSPAPRIMGDAAAIAEAKRKAKEGVQTAAKPKAYVPPSQRNRAGAGGSSLAERMRREKEGTMQGASKVVRKGIPGAASVTQKKLPVGMTPSAPAGRSKNAERKARQKANKAKAEEEAAQLKVAEEAAARAAAAADPEKRARKLKKTLKQIEELKAKPESDLNDDQKKKLATEEDLRAELAKLGV